RPGHPNEFVEELLHTAAIGRVSIFAGRRIEKLSCRAEIDVRENCDQPQLAQHREQTLDHARAAKRTRRYAANTDCLVNVFFQVCVEHMLQQTWETVIIFRNDE